MNLNSFKQIKNNLSSASFKTISLHSLIFVNEGHPRQARKELRLFRGFSFKLNTKEHAQKMIDIEQNFSFADLVIICDVLDLSHEGEKTDLIDRVCKFLIDFEKNETEDEDDESLREDDAELDENDIENDDENENEIKEDDSLNSDEEITLEAEGRLRKSIENRREAKKTNSKYKFEDALEREDKKATYKKIKEELRRLKKNVEV